MFVEAAGGGVGAGEAVDGGGEEEEETHQSRLEMIRSADVVDAVGREGWRKYSSRQQVEGGTKGRRVSRHFFFFFFFFFVERFCFI